MTKKIIKPEQPEIEMNSSTVPWHIFLDALRPQQPGKPKIAAPVIFANEGVIVDLDPVEFER